MNIKQLTPVEELDGMRILQALADPVRLEIVPSWRAARRRGSCRAAACGCR